VLSRRLEKAHRLDIAVAQLLLELPFQLARLD
jgi:hypothetical protein